MNLTLAAEYRPFRRQVEFHESKARFKVATSGNRGGKTLSGGAEFVWKVYQDYAAGRGKQAVRFGSSRIPKLHYWVITPTKELGEYPYREIVRYTPRELIESINATTNEIWLRGDIQIEFKSTERAERLVAASLNGVWMDEAPRCKPESWRGGLRARLADQEGWALFTGSPFGGKSSWLYQDIVLLHGRDGYEAFHWTTADNPYIPRTEIENARRTLPSQWFKRDWLADWESFGGSIYEEFSDANILKDAQFRLEFGLGRDAAPTAYWAKQRFRRVVCGVDFGFTSPGAMVVIGQVSENQFVVLEESYAANRPILGDGKTWLSEARRLRDAWGVDIFVCDHDPGAITDLVTNGINAISAFKDIHMGIRRVAEAVHPNDGRCGLRIVDTCSHLVSEMRSYMWKPAKDQNGFGEVPADGQSDHACDALRYGLLELKPYSIDKAGRRPSFGRPLG